MPSVKCGCCSKFMSPIDGAKCNKCCVYYHRLCAALPQSGSLPTTWRCLECKKNVSRETRTDTPARGHDLKPAATSSPHNITLTSAQETVADIGLELSRIRDELHSVRCDFQAFREEVAELRALSARVDGIEKRVEALEQASKDRATTNDTSTMDETVAELKRDLNDRDQDLLANDIEISNIPESGGENLSHVMALIATKLGVPFEERDIVSADRIGGRHINATDTLGLTEKRPRLIVVRFARRDLRDEILRGARVRRNVNTENLNLPGQPKRFYVNERLTKYNRVLFRQARDAGQRFGWKFVWTSRGRILARRKPGDDVHRIRCDTDIQRILGAGAEAESDKVY